MDLSLNSLFVTLVRIVATLRSSDQLLTSDLVIEAPTEKLFLKMLQEKEAMIWRVTRMYCKIADDQRDLFQDIVGRLWTGFPSFRSESSVTTWVYTVCLHTALSRVRKKQLQFEALDNLPEASQPATRHDPAGETNLVEVLDGLPYADKAIIFLLMEGYGYAEIATILGFKPNTVVQRVRRLRSKLKEHLTL